MNEKIKMDDIDLSNESGTDSLKDNITPDSFFCSEVSISDISGQITINFDVKDIEKIKLNQIRSECIETRTVYWRIMVTTKGTEDSILNDIEKNDSKYLSIYVQCDPIKESKFWHCYAKCKINLHNQDINKTNSKEFRNTFSRKENDFGYSEYISFKKLLDKKNGYLDPYKTGDLDTISISVDIISEYPYGVYWDSRQNTNHVGLLNLGATCYMNSLLQLFFFTNQLRLATYNTPTYMDDNSNSIMYALQYIFYQLQFNKSAVDTAKLTNAFGWTQADSFQQHDVQEFCRILLESVENSMKGTAAENTISKLLEGKQMSYIKCINVNYQSERIESVYDIQLKVKGLNNVYESFDDYIKIEKLEGENKYAAGEYGYQEADKGVIFTHFPPVLHLHLMRFTYDIEHLDFVKLRDRYEFPEILDLTSYMRKEDIDIDDPPIYTLAAVLVHIGGINSGHYVVYINVDCSGEWLKFDDEVVVKVNKNEAIDDNYGGSGINVFKVGTTAYMLSYVRNSSKDHVFKQISSQDIPNNLKNRILYDLKYENYQKYKIEHINELILIEIILEENLYTIQTYGFIENNINKINGFCFEFFKDYDIKYIFKYICEKFKVSINNCRLWIYTEKNNGIYLFKLIYPKYYNYKLQDITTNNKILLYLDIIPNIDKFIDLQNDELNEKLKLFQQDNLNIFNYKNCIIFVKYYNIKLSKLIYMGYLHVDINQTWDFYLNDIIEITKLKSELINENQININLYIENGNNLPIKIENLNSLIILNMLEGTSCILCVEHILSNYQLNNIQNGQSQLESEFFIENNNFLNFMSIQLKSIKINFVDKFLPNSIDRKFTINCLRTNKQPDILLLLKNYISHPIEKVQLYIANYNKIGYNKIERYCENSPLTIGEIEQNFILNDKSFTILYECIDVNVKDLENNILLNLKFIPKGQQICNIKNNEILKTFLSAVNVPLLLSKNSTIKDILKEAKKYLLSINYPLKNRLRLLEIISSKVVSLLGDLIEITRITPSIEKTLFIEEITTDQTIQITSNDRLVNCCFTQNNNFRYFIGIPFLLKISNGMTFDDIVKKIQTNLVCYSEDFIDQCSIYLLNIYEVDPINISNFSPNLKFPFDKVFGKLKDPRSDEVLNGEENLHFCPNVVIAININSSFSFNSNFNSNSNNSAFNLHSNSNKAVLKITK